MDQLLFFVVLMLAGRAVSGAPEVGAVVKVLIHKGAQAALAGLTMGGVEHLVSDGKQNAVVSIAAPPEQLDNASMGTVTAVIITLGVSATVFAFCLGCVMGFCKLRATLENLRTG